MNPQPSAEAIALAVLLSGHTACYIGHPRFTPCGGCLDNAAIIDRELQLPERNAALLLAQSVIKEWDRRTMETPMRFAEVIGELREALEAIK